MQFPSYADVNRAARRLRAAVSGAAPELKDRPGHPLSAAVRLWLTLFAVQDTILILYLSIVAGLLCRRGAAAVHGARMVLCCLTALVVACVTFRATRLPAPMRAAVYRVTLVGVVVANYLMLRELLPLIRPDAVDEALLKLDIALFGVAPARWLERMNQRAVIEWFSFFYFSYFLLCIGYVVTVLWLDRLGRHTTEFAITTVLLYCAGQLGYMAVPAYGPVHYVEFTGPLRGGLFWGWVESAVEAGGALKDTFPSMHTAAPLWFTGFAFEQATRDRRWRLPAWLTAFFAANIMVSTVVLRWHYVVDVLAGVALYLATTTVARRLAQREEELRARCGLALAFGFATTPRHPRSRRSSRPTPESRRDAASPTRTRRRTRRSPSSSSSPGTRAGASS